MSDDLIRRLVLDLQPVQRLASPARRTVQFAVPHAALVVASTWAAGLRADLLSKLHEPAYLAETAVLVALFAGATFAALSSGIPGARLRSAFFVLALAAGAWLVLVSAYFARPLDASISSGVACVRRTLLLGVVPATTLFVLLRRSAPLSGGTSGALAMVSAGALAVLGTRALCGKDDGLHVVLWHVLPLAALLLLGSVVGRAWLHKASARPLRSALRP